MKKSLILYVLFAAMLLCACSNDALQDVVVQNDTSELFCRLDSLTQHYVKSRNDSRPLRRQSDDKEFTKEEKTKIAKADMEGFAIGAGLIGSAGALVGAAAGGPIGAAIGGVSAGTVAGAAYAAVWSKNAANEILADRAEALAVDDIYKIDPFKPLIEDTIPGGWLDFDIKGANAGFLHNYALSRTYGTYSEDFFELGVSETADNVLTTLEGELPDSIIEDARVLIYENIANDFNNLYGNTSEAESDEIIQYYFNSLEEVADGNRFAFTEEFMRLVSEYCHDEERIFFVNGCISVYNYSCHLWNLNVPDPIQNRYLCYDKIAHSFVTLCSSSPDFIDYITAKETYSLIFVPKIRNNRIIALFAFDSQNVLNTVHNAYVNGQDPIYFQTHGNPIVTFHDEDRTYDCPEGLYEFQRFREGYVVLFE